MALSPARARAVSLNGVRWSGPHALADTAAALGAARPVHILTPTSTVRRLVNMTALTAVDAASHRSA